MKTALLVSVVLPPYRGQLLANPDFAGDTTTGWLTGNSATLSVVSSRLRTTNGGANFGYAYQAFRTIPGRRYRIQATRNGATSTANTYLRAGTTLNGYDYFDTLRTNSTPWSDIFTATTSLCYLMVVNAASTLGLYSDVSGFDARLYTA